MKTYQSYKESGIEWIGKIPKDWQVKKIKKICLKNSSNLSLESLEKKKGEFILYGAPGIIKKIAFYNEEKEYLGIVKDGAGVGRIFLCEKNSSVLGTLDIIKKKYNSNLKYLYYILNQIEFENFINGSTIPHIYFKDYSLLKIPIPPLQTQKTIANYLDNKTSKIDKIISNKKKQIELFEEYKKSLINKIVTKGINEKEFKESGIEWIGKIPKDWEIKKIKYISKVITGNTPPTKDKENYKTGIYLWIKPENLLKFEEIKETKEKLSEVGKKLGRELNNENILINCIGDIGKFGVCKKEIFFTNQQINSIKLKRKQNFNFFTFLFSILKEEQDKYSNEVVVKILNKDTQENIKIPIPPLQTQKTIADYLDNKTSKIDKIINNKKEQIKYFEEYKKSLINDCVLGKICVE